MVVYASIESTPAARITNISITSSGTATVGESYSLVCTVSMTRSTDKLTIQWTGPMGTITSGVETTDNESILTLNPLETSHAGTYICRATLGSVTYPASATVTVQSE